MNTFRFRTECEHDGNRVPELLKRMGITSYQFETINSEKLKTYLMGQFTFDSSETLEIVVETMENLIEAETRDFPDMHRCYQTLNYIADYTGTSNNR